MTPLDPIDARLRTAFEALRAADAGETPRFDAVIALTPRTIAPNPARRITKALAAAAALLLAVTLVYPAFRPATLAVPREVLALSAWTSPTTALLEGATRPLVTRAPVLGASLLDSLPGERR